MECSLRYHEAARTGKLIGLIFSCLVVAVMLFMMFAVLGGLFSAEQ